MSRRGGYRQEFWHRIVEVHRIHGVVLVSNASVCCCYQKLGKKLPTRDCASMMIKNLLARGQIVRLKHGWYVLA